MCNILDYKDQKLIYKRYASLYFCMSTDFDDNELIALEIIHRYVQLLDEYFGNVCELDIIFGMQNAYNILDEYFIGGEVQETSRVRIMKSIAEAHNAESVELLDSLVA